MATAAQIKALIKSHLERDEDRFLAIAIQVAAHAARQGRGKVAAEIREIVDAAKRGAPSRGDVARPIPIATPRGDLAALLSVSYPKARLADMVLATDVRVRLERILREQRGRDKIEIHGLFPRRKLLLVGPPGSGKTMTAAALAGELAIPLYVIQLHGLITKFMGETAAKLRLVFDALAQQRGVYLFDEFDALGSERGAGHDVGEIRRVLNSFLQFLEQDASASLLVAATNHPAALDRALFRRFDDVVRYRLPSEGDARRLLEQRLASFARPGLDWRLIGEASRDLSFAELAAAGDAAIKTAILDGEQHVTTEVLGEALDERRSEHEPI
jgi:SpoVK/Ycf46/Vps4 family AAA+-type ATPase